MWWFPIWIGTWFPNTEPSPFYWPQQWFTQLPKTLREWHVPLSVRFRSLAQNYWHLSWEWRRLPAPPRKSCSERSPCVPECPESLSCGLRSKTGGAPRRLSRPVLVRRHASHSPKRIYFNFCYLKEFLPSCPLSFSYFLIVFSSIIEF